MKKTDKFTPCTAKSLEISRGLDNHLFGEKMVIGANQGDFQSVVDKAPPSFGLFFWYSDDVPSNWHAATITKEKDHFVYELRSDAENDTSVSEYKSKVDLIERMESDNHQFNAGGKVTIEF